MQAITNQTAGSAKLTKVEQKFQEQLQQQLAAGEILWWGEHPFNLRLGHNLRYEPDFAAVTRDGVIEVYEVKGTSGFNATRFNGGHIGRGDQSRIKLKAAAAAFPLFRFVAAVKQKKRDGGGFELEVIPPRLGLSLPTP